MDALLRGFEYHRPAGDELLHGCAVRRAASALAVMVSRGGVTPTGACGSFATLREVLREHVPPGESCAQALHRVDLAQHHFSLDNGHQAVVHLLEVVFWTQVGMTVRAETPAPTPIPAHVPSVSCGGVIA